ncbi:uncharacterized protein FIBRA_00813 [Fibroporia radiculosa]|uniref:Uncharacterized protein n=1 Tax=Fibroporia radiculosa TaxID=599839 RepID=J4G0M2_9APHY|nr:uncharacterized protein FIBRA_00813 [Fibroporia radiculosa]CCL98808.1 predicted protein [Fibroporia radiculosa]
MATPWDSAASRTIIHPHTPTFLDVPTGPEAQPFIREARPVYNAKKVESWLSVGQAIWNYIDSLEIEWTFINPLAYANAGEAEPFCSFVVVIGVKPLTVSFSHAVDVATTAQNMLICAGFAEAEAAVVEGDKTYSVSQAARGPQLLSFDPLLDDVRELRHLFSSTLGLSISPFKFPHYAGTGSLYYQFGGDDKRVALLTCAHVACPPLEYPNTDKIITNPSQSREEIISPGPGAYDSALKALQADVDRQIRSIKIRDDVLVMLGDPMLNEDARITKRRTEHLLLVDGAKERIEQVKELLNVVQDRVDPSKRAIGFVLHCEPIEVSSGPRRFTKDWALIELYNDMIDWNAFRGNRVYVAARITGPQYGEIMWPQAADSADYKYPANGLLQAYGVVQEDELRNPQHLDIYNQKCLLVVKNGATTGTTFGRVNGLESFIRHYPPYGIDETSTEIAVLRYSKDYPRFSESGDSGPIVLDRTGKIVGVLTGGVGPTDGTDISYITPYFDIHAQLTAKYPSICLYPVIN